MATYLGSQLSRGQSGVAEFAIADYRDLRVADTIAVDLSGRDAIEEWRRTSYMSCYVVSEDKSYRLGSDITIAGQAWTEIVYGNPDALVSSDVFDVDGYFLSSKMRNLFINDAFVVASEGAMLALSTVTGNVVVRSDTGDVYLKLNNDDPSDISDFANITSTTGAVTSVNGQTGAVSITIANLLSVPGNLTDFNSAVASNSLVSSHSASIASLTTNKSDLVSGTVPLSQLPYLFQSGLTPTDTEVKLGGSLLYNTSIIQGNFNFNFDASGTGNFVVDFGSDADYDIFYRLSGVWARLAKGSDGQVLKMNGGQIIWGTDSGGGGVSTFIALTDVPSSYTGSSLQSVRVKSDESGLEFFTAANPNTITASNGLTKVSSDIQFGGILTSNRAIDGAFSVVFGGTTPLSLFQMSTTGAQTFSATGNIAIESTTNNIQLTAANNFTIAGTSSVSIGSSVQNSMLVSGGASYTQQSNGVFTGRHSFTPTSTISGFAFGSLNGDPSSLTNSDAWYNSSSSRLMARISGGTHEFVFRTLIQTLTNKTISGTSNSFSNIPLSTAVTGLLPYANIIDGAGLSVVGRSANSSGVQADIVASSDNTLLRRSGTSIGFGTIPAVSGLTMSTDRILGRTTASTGVVQEIQVLNGLSFGTGTLRLGGPYTDFALDGGQDDAHGFEIIGANTAGDTYAQAVGSHTFISPITSGAYELLSLGSASGSFFPALTLFGNEIKFGLGDNSNTDNWHAFIKASSDVSDNTVIAFVDNRTTKIGMQYNAATKNYAHWTNDTFTDKGYVDSRIGSDAVKVKHKRVTTGSVSASSSSLVTITWTTAFADSNYTPTVSMLDSTTSNLSLQIVHVESISASAITVRVYNSSVGSLTGTILAQAIHD